MTNYREFRPKVLPLFGLGADPKPQEVQPGEWNQHDQFHVLNRRIWKYAGWEKWNPESDYYYEDIIGEL